MRNVDELIQCQWHRIQWLSYWKRAGRRGRKRGMCVSEREREREECVGLVFVYSMIP